MRQVLCACGGEVVPMPKTSGLSFDADANALINVLSRLMRVIATHEGEVKGEWFVPADGIIPVEQVEGHVVKVYHEEVVADAIIGVVGGRDYTILEPEITDWMEVETFVPMVVPNNEEGHVIAKLGLAPHLVG